MLNEIYKQVKRCLNTVPGLQGVEWFNNQYQGIIHAEPVVFVEFPKPVVPDPVTKTTRMADLEIRVHVVSSIIADADNSVPDTQVTGHESIATLVLQSLEGQIFVSGEQEIRPLKFSTWEHYHKWTGWMVTFIDFKTRIPV